MKKIYKSVLGITGAKGSLGSFFIRNNKDKYIFKIYRNRIESKKNLTLWLNENKDIEIFLHLAGVSTIEKSKQNSKKTYLINTSSTIQLIKLINYLKLDKLKYFLFASTSHVYKPSFNKISEKSKRDPLTIYGKSKKKAEDFIIKNKNNLYFKIGVARIFNFHSINHKQGFFIYDLIKKLKENKKNLYIKKINTLRDYINLDQLCDILNFMIKKRIANPLNVGSGKPINLINLVKKIKKKYKIKSNIKFQNKRFPGLFADNKMIKKLGYKKAFKNFIL